MATSTSWAQDVITCDLCDKAAQQFCNRCQVSICEICVRKHRDELKSQPHDIVPFLDRKIQVVCPKCQDHSGQRLRSTAKNELDLSVWNVWYLHKEHEIEELTKTHENKIRKIKSEFVHLYHNSGATLHKGSLLENAIGGRLIWYVHNIIWYDYIWHTYMFLKLILN